MCGICGVINLESEEPVREDLLSKMSSVLRHRGPDDEGKVILPGAKVGLAHRRLSIIDVEGGHEPMSNEDETLWLVFNGEIYNFQQLRADLQEKGHRFRTKCDAEVILHCYEEKGIKALEDFRGMFAFAIYDEKAERLFLARDRLGQKPLVYALFGGRFYFASEIKSILQVPGIPREVEILALHHYLTYQYVPHPLTMFKGIYKLPPANYILLSKRGLEKGRYWQPDFSRQVDLPEEEYLRQVRKTLEEATRLRLISDVPLGAFLSGGIDSSIIVALMNLHSNRPVRTFSIGFEEKKYDELQYARLIAKRYKTEHTEFVVRPVCLEVLPDLIWHYDEPFADSSAVPTYYVARETSRFVKVALTGDAGDECFAGYPRYQAVKLSSYLDRLPEFLRGVLSHPFWQRLPAPVEQKSLRRRLKKFAKALSQSPEERYLRWICIFDEELKDELYTEELKARLSSHPSSYYILEPYAHLKGRDFLTRTTYVDLLTYLPSDLLVKVDIASMAHSLETRSPFLDHKVVELAGRMPVHLKLRAFKSKYILKKAFADLLPAEILNRGKMGFGVPISAWFRGELKSYVHGLLLDEKSVRRGYFRRETLERLLGEHIEGKFDHGYRLWSLLVLEEWHRRFID